MKSPKKTKRAKRVDPQKKLLAGILIICAVVILAVYVLTLAGILEL